MHQFPLPLDESHFLFDFIIQDQVAIIGLTAKEDFIGTIIFLRRGRHWRPCIDSLARVPYMTSASSYDADNYGTYRRRLHAGRRFLPHAQRNKYRAAYKNTIASNAVTPFLSCKAATLATHARSLRRKIVLVLLAGLSFEASLIAR